MKIYGYLNMSRWGLLFCALLISINGQAELLPEEIQIHGFLTQDFFHSSDNNVNGLSDDGISPGRTEIGLNISYQAFDRLTFSAQGLYRRAGYVDKGSVRLDYGLADLNLFNYQNGHIGIRGGRIKIPFGLYNETRDVAFTNPTILLPQGVYFDRSRSLFTSADGGSLYVQHRTDWGDFSFKFNYGLALGNNEEIMATILSPDAKGEFKANPAIATQIMYDLNGGEYVFAVSYLDLKLKYHSADNEVFSSGYTTIRPLLFSAQYNGEKLGLAAEYLYRWNHSKNYDAIPDNRSITESWFIQGSYRFISQLQGIVRYETLSLTIDDRSGNYAVAFGLPKHIAYSKDWMLGLRWDITSSLMMRTEYHRIHGTAWLAQADNQDRSKTRENWNLYALQVSYRF
ncbi:MAG: hypothetical protein HFP81_08320 [Methylococcales symbiont of Hymedesmia sp. n. MRB-2018]|nr:MAG: hypothetical protein HFP78_08540 [Methylococcales symbiont of Hymedesmia sp. n. MRB-2018]KAF3983181.1 MAG: hypothetical protein HFP81_08320 [Methylococcales symbiont of Hymedesmia sp. n. MRB-2018]